MKSLLRPGMLFLIAITLGALISALSLYSQSIRLDESQQIWMSAKPIGSILKLIGEDVHVPLYAILVHYWMQIFGTNIIVVRTLSFFFFLATIPALYIVVREVSGKRVAAFTVLFFVVSPFIIWYSQEARMYTLFTFVTCVNHYFFLKCYRSRAKEGKLGYYISLLLGMYTHYFFSLLVATQGVFVLYRTLVRIIRTRKQQHISFFQALSENISFPLTMLLLVFGAYIFLIPWLAYVLHLGFISNEEPLIPKPTSYNIFQAFVNYLFGFQTQTAQSVLVSLWPLMVIFLFFIFTQRKHIPTKHIDYFVLATFFPILLVFFGSYIRPIFLTRYLIFITPTLFFLLAWSLNNFPKKFAFPATATFLMIMLFFLFYQNSSAASPIKENYKETTQYLNLHVTGDDIIAVTAPFTTYPIEYYYTGPARITTIPVWDRYVEGPLPAFSQKGLVTEMNDLKKVYKRVFIVFSYDQGYQKAIRTYMDQHYQVLFHKQFSTDIELRVYKLRYDI